MSRKTNFENAFIFDLDGTLADLSHRIHHISGEEKDFNAFFEDCVNDTVIEDVVKLLRLLAETNEISIISGRSDKVEEQTKRWLQTHGIPWDFLFMRKEGDHRPDIVVKKELFFRYLHTSLREEKSIRGVFEDRKQVVQMWRELGLTCYQVKDGDY